MIGKYIKVLLVTLIVVFVLAYVGIRQQPYSFLFAWVLNFSLMMAVFYYTNTFKPKLNSAYYELKSWEKSGAIYKQFGVNIFRKVLVWVGWEKVIKAANPVKKNLDAIKHLEFGTRQSEFGHLVVLFIVLIVNILVAFYYGFIKSLPLFFLNIIFNFYPIILQRYNRPRLLRAIALHQNRK